MSEKEVLEKALQGAKLPIKVPALIERYRAAKAKISRLQLDNLESLIDQLFPGTVKELLDLRILAEECLPVAQDAAELASMIVSRVTQHDVPEDPDFVRIMSLHKSKGLTSPVVYIMGALNGIIPTITGTLTDEEIDKAVEEQRRLFYVAVTRSSDQVVISSCRWISIAMASSMGINFVKNGTRRFADKLMARTIASPYLAELGPDAPAPVDGTHWLTSYGEGAELEIVAD